MSEENQKSSKNEFLSELNIDLSELDSVDIMGNRVRLNVDPKLFLGFFSMPQIIDALQTSGITNGLEKKGFKNWELELDTQNSGDHRLIIVDRISNVRLVFMRLHVGSFSAQNIPVNLENLRLLFIDWLLLQNPLLPIKPNKLFPGQKYPGNGLFSEVKTFMIYLIKKAKLDGAANLPEFFHDAVLFADRFYFLDPKGQGEFEALLRDLRKRGLRKLSRLIHSGKIERTPKGKQTHMYEFRHGEMVVPNSPELRSYFESKTYTESVKKFKDRVSFTISPQKA